MQIFNDDCLNVLPKLEDRSVDLIVADIPYNVTSHSWDTFETQSEYIKFLSDVFCECERVLKPTGSIYIFQSDFNQIMQINQMLQNDTNFLMKNMVIWNKRWEGSKRYFYQTAQISRDNLKHFQKYCEYIMFYVLKSESDSDKIHRCVDNFRQYKDYIATCLKEKGLTYNSDCIVRTLYDNMGYKSMQSARSISQRLFNEGLKAFGVMSEKQYDILKEIVGFEKPYSEIYNMYYNEKKNLTVETEQYTFNNFGTHHSVWNYEEIHHKQKKHPTQKPVDLIENIILHSSNVGDIVLDPFMGVGTTGIACKNNGRDFIGIELDKKYFDIAKSSI